MLNTIATGSSSSGASKPDKKYLGSAELRGLGRFGGRVNALWVNFAVCDLHGELVLLCEGNFKSSRELLVKCSRTSLERSGDRREYKGGDSVFQFDEANMVLSIVLRTGETAVGVALIDSGCNCSEEEDNSHGDIRIAMFGEMLGLLAEKFEAEVKAGEEIEMVGAELAQTYEELVLLHKLSTNMKVTEADTSYLQMACDSLTEIVSVEGIAVLLEKSVDDEKRWVLAAGSGLIDIDERMAAILYDRLLEEVNSGKEALLDSEVDSPFKYDWPDNVGNIIAVPLYGKDRLRSSFSERSEDNHLVMGLMVAINRIGKQDFDSTDVKLFNSVASGCAVFVENGRLFRDLKELFIGSLRALTSSIDAKDQYTRGHSERVAFISRWIAERLAELQPLEEEQIHKIYLAGLLHDIGKMGIDEAVLRKKGRLTRQELNRIRKHPSIGASILGEIKQMRDIVPGVLCHHERIDGKGYPHGLAGDQIPLIGQIVGLADCFDAMTSKRVYRHALTVEQALGEIERGLGTQFDEKTGRIFINSNVYELWDIIQEGFTEIYGDNDLSEYGAVAVGTLVR